MAETSQTKGVTPDYRLRTDTLDRIKGAGKRVETYEDYKSGWDALGDLGTTMTAGAKAAQKAQEVESKRIAESDAAWDESFATAGNRGSFIMSPALFDKFQIHEKSFQAEYQEVVQSGDKEGATNLLAKQKMRSEQINKWKGVFTSAQVQDNDNLWSKHLSEKDRAIVTVLNNQKSDEFEISFDKNDNMIFNISGVDEPVTLEYYTEMMEKGLKPTTVEVEFKSALKALNTSAQNNAVWNMDRPVLNETTQKLEGGQNFMTHLSNNKKLITKKNIHSVMNNDFTESITGTTFMQDFLSHPEFTKPITGLPTTFDKMNTDDIPGISSEEFLVLSEADKKLVIAELEKDENFDALQGYIAEWMTLKMQQRSQTTRSEYENHRSSKYKFDSTGNKQQ